MNLRLTSCFLILLISSCVYWGCVVDCYPSECSSKFIDLTAKPCVNYFDCEDYNDCTEDYCDSFPQFNAPGHYCINLPAFGSPCERDGDPCTLGTCGVQGQCTEASVTNDTLVYTSDHC